MVHSKTILNGVAKEGLTAERRIHIEFLAIKHSSNEGIDKHDN